MTTILANLKTDHVRTNWKAAKHFGLVQSIPSALGAQYPTHELAVNSILPASWIGSSSAAPLVCSMGRSLNAHSIALAHCTSSPAAAPIGQTWCHLINSETQMHISSQPTYVASCSYIRHTHTGGGLRDLLHLHLHVGKLESKCDWVFSLFHPIISSYSIISANPCVA